uniref:Uncharacterized protein n=1 Tax=Rhizophora mucronata TaxID=61149 RepID=A0A2P2Q3I8_RHIMU
MPILLPDNICLKEKITAFFSNRRQRSLTMQFEITQNLSAFSFNWTCFGGLVWCLHCLMTGKVINQYLTL